MRTLTHRQVVLAQKRARRKRRHRAWWRQHGRISLMGRPHATNRHKHPEAGLPLGIGWIVNLVATVAARRQSRPAMQHRHARRQVQRRGARKAS